MVEIQGKESCWAGGANMRRRRRFKCSSGPVDVEIDDDRQCPSFLGASGPDTYIYRGLERSGMKITWKRDHGGTFVMPKLLTD